MNATSDSWTGGCQCGAVRYCLRAIPHDPHLCHCRMCQKQFGNFFAALASVAAADFELTRGALSYFHSSANIRRGFCAACGTPMTYEPVPPKTVSIAIPTLDQPDAVIPSFQYGSESMSPHFKSLAALPAAETGVDRDGKVYAEWRDAIMATARQHPDHDTDQWPQHSA